jgi:hypothetical protein
MSYMSNEEYRKRALSGKGTKTRNTILQILEEMLTTRNLYDIRAIDITRHTRIGSAAMFYSYFKTLPEAARVLLAEKVQEERELTEYEQLLKATFEFEDKRAQPEET